MTVFQTFIRRKALLTVGACFAIGVATPHALAGFEWVPQKKSPVVVDVPQPEAPVAAEIEDDQFLPLPSSSELQEPVMIVEEEPVIIVEPTPPPMLKPSPIAPNRISVIPKEAPNSGAIAVQQPAPLPPLAAPEPMVTIPEPVAADTSPEMLKKPPFEMTKTRIIVPDDAPANAVEQVEKKHSTIVPFPSQESLQETQEPPVTFVNATPATQALAPMENAVGFAQDVPLALALRQVVPSHYAFSFGNNVNPGLRVSWNGGKPWNEVVADMVTSIGYAVVITQKTVHVVTQEHAMATPDTSAAPAMLEPAAGDEDMSAVMPVARERNIKRINIVDPGSNQ